MKVKNLTHKDLFNFIGRKRIFEWDKIFVLGKLINDNQNCIVTIGSCKTLNEIYSIIPSILRWNK